MLLSPRILHDVALGVNPISMDQIRLRRAIAFPLDPQNVSSSGFHSEIQVVARFFIKGVPLRWTPLPNRCDRKLWPRGRRCPRDATTAIAMPSPKRVEVPAVAQPLAAYDLCDAT